MGDGRCRGGRASALFGLLGGFALVAASACSLTLASDDELSGGGAKDGAVEGAPAADGPGAETSSGDVAAEAANDAATPDAGADSASGDASDTGSGADTASGGDTGSGNDTGASDTGGANDASDASDAGTLTYAQTILADAPIAYWRFGDASGASAMDSSGNGHTGAYTACVLGQAGALLNDTDTAASFNGTSSTMTSTGPYVFAGTGNFTIEGWFKPNTISATNYHHLLNQETATGSRQGYAVFVTSGAVVGFERFISGTNTISYGPTIAIGQWYHVAATYDGAELTLYVNGAFASATADARAAIGTTDPFYVGCGETVKFFDGTIDEVAIYGTALSAARINAHFHASGR
jgi:hypothetical protein